MYRILGKAKLKTGETAEIGLVTAPDAEHAEQIKPFLAHKGGNWNWHVERSLAEDLDKLATRYYVAKLDREIVANVMTLEYAHCGILGHVFTNPAHRRKHAISCVFDHLMPDFRERGGALVLGTGFESAAYWIYHNYGFRSIVPDTGFMRYATADDFEAKLYQPAPAVARPTLWRDWPRLSVLTSRHEGAHLRSIWLSRFGPSSFEGSFLAVKCAVEQGSAQCAVLETEAEVVPGFATLAKDSRWEGRTWLLDFFVHPNFEDQAPALLAAIDWPQAKVQCYVDAHAKGKQAALEASGFTKEATLKKQIARGENELDVLVYAR